MAKSELCKTLSVPQWGKSLRKHYWNKMWLQKSFCPHCVSSMRMWKLTTGFWSSAVISSSVVIMDSSCSSRSSLVVRSVSSSFSIPVIVFEPAKNEKNSGKVENILKGSLNLISSPSPSVEIQIMGGKVCLRCKDKTLLGVVNKHLKIKSLLTSSGNVLLHYLK